MCFPATFLCIHCLHIKRLLDTWPYRILCILLSIYLLYSEVVFLKSMRGNIIECFLVNVHTSTTVTKKTLTLNPRSAPYQLCDFGASYYLLWSSSLSPLCLPHRSYHSIRKYFCASFCNRPGNKQGTCLCSRGIYHLAGERDLKE